MYGLEPTLLISKNALVMLTMNLWPSVGLCNGATGTVVDIIYTTPITLQICLLVLLLTLTIMAVKGLNPGVISKSIIRSITRV